MKLRNQMPMKMDLSFFGEKEAPEAEDYTDYEKYRDADGGATISSTLRMAIAGSKKMDSESVATMKQVFEDIDKGNSMG